MSNIPTMTPSQICFRLDETKNLLTMMQENLDDETPHKVRASLKRAASNVDLARQGMGPCKGCDSYKICSNISLKLTR